MGCEQAGMIQRLLDGELSAKRTRSALDHIRACEQCQQRLRTASEVAPTAARGPEEPVYQRYTHEEVEAARSAPNPGKRRGLMALIMVAILTIVAGVGSGELGGKSESEADQECREAMADGRPWPVAPMGECERPRQIRCALPPGSSAFSLRISKDGAVVWEKRFSSGEPGVEMFASAGGTGDRAYEAVAAFAPFPAPDELALVVDEVYEYRVILDSGSISPPVSFTVVQE